MEKTRRGMPFGWEMNASHDKSACDVGNSNESPRALEEKAQYAKESDVRNCPCGRLDVAAS